MEALILDAAPFLRSTLAVELGGLALALFWGGILWYKKRIKENSSAQKTTLPL